MELIAFGTDSKGHFFVNDTFNHCVQVFSAFDGKYLGPVMQEFGEKTGGQPGGGRGDTVAKRGRTLDGDGSPGDSSEAGAPDRKLIPVGKDPWMMFWNEPLHAFLEVCEEDKEIHINIYTVEWK